MEPPALSEISIGLLMLLIMPILEYLVIHRFIVTAFWVNSLLPILADQSQRAESSSISFFSITHILCPILNAQSQCAVSMRKLKGGVRLRTRGDVKGVLADPVGADFCDNAQFRKSYFRADGPNRAFPRG